MASVDLEYNQGFKIYNANGTRFNNLVLHKATYETVVMSLGDKISGIVYYKNNKLVVNMTEYIMYKNVKYVLVNPPTVIKEGLVSDNGELKGMTKYSFTFYHPMYMLSNFPFSDVAVDNSQKKYLSQNKTFSWIGNLTDYVAKLNKNLEGTQWKVSIGTNVTNAEKNKLSEVLSFDNNTIADALKTAYETWEIPYIVDKVETGTQDYLNGKRFVVQFGLPSNEIYEVDEEGEYVLDDNNEKIPFVFKYGQGVGLKNNSRTPKNNKIVTRIAGYGSEDNIPYGYPQIVWTGNQSWNYTINNDSTAANSYPIYDGIVGGQKVRLIKHPFTRTHLMPPIYSETVNKKVNPNATGYNPNTELVDYYDANDNTYPNQIKAGEQSYEIHEFGDIKPEFGSFSINSAAPYDGHSDESITQNKFLSIVDDLYTETDIKAEKTQLNALRTSFVTQQQNSAKGTSGNYEYDWSFKTDGLYKKVKYASSGANFEYVVNVGLTPATIDWDDTMDEQGNYVQSYFKVTIPALGFDLYASAAITQEMTINMRSGACIGCSFPVMVDWDDYKRNFYDKDGNFAPNGTQRNYTKYPNSTNASITLILQKETNTFGTLMPNIYQKPASGNKFVILGISLPTSYITTAEAKLETEMKKYMRDNNVYYYEYPLKFDEHFLISNEHILSQMKPNVIVNFEYADVEQSLYIKQMSIKYNESPLPKYDITLTDDVDVVLNKIGEAIAEYRGQRQYENRGGNSETLDGNKFLRKDINDTASGTIRMLKGLQVGERFVTGLLGEGGIFRKDDDGTTYLECDRMYVRMKAYFDTVEVRRFLHSGGNRIASAAGMKCSRVEYIAANGSATRNVSDAVKFRCYFRAEDNGAKVTNDFVVGDLAYCKETNIDTNLSQHGYWRAVVGVSSNANSSGEHWIDLSKSDCSPTLNDVPIAQDDIIQLGNKTAKARQGAIVEYVSGEDAPSYQIYQGINTYNLDNKNYIGLGYSSDTGRAYMNVYGDFLFGDKAESTYIKYNAGTKKLEIKADVKFKSPDDPTQDTTLEDFASAVTDDIDNLQSQIDGQIETWFYDYDPAVNNAPASNWTTTSERNNHLGDLFYNTTSGYAWRWGREETAPNVYEYKWYRITDVDVVKALADAAKAQDTADHKRRVFTAQPYPPYDVGDLWSNAIFPANNTEKDAANNKYYKDLLTCKTAKAEGGSFAIADWSLTTNYTDDTALTNFVSNTYAPFVQNIQGQVDQKAETWYQDDDPSSAWTTDALKASHVGDIWCNTSQNGGKKTYIWKDFGTSANPRYVWAEQSVPDEVFDKIDGKADIFVSKPTTYNVNDMWIIESGLSSTDMPTGCQSGDIVISNASRVNNYQKTDWSKKDRYTDDTKYNNFISALLNGMPQGSTEATVEAALNAIKAALNQGTTVSGGLVLSTLIGLRDSNNVLWSGINGQYDANALGGGIAAWYGGGMIDHEASPSASGYAKSLFRFDGSGYLAGGNITWDAQGRVAIKDITTLVGGNNTDILNALTTFNNAFHFTTAQGSSTILNINPQYAFSHLEIYDVNGNHAVATTDWVSSNYVSIAFFNRLFQAYSSTTTTDANKVSPNEATAINNLKILVGAWTDQYLSAKGINPQQSGGGGVGDVTWDLLASQATNGRTIHQSYIADVLSGYATQLWVMQQISGKVSRVDVGTTQYSPNGGVVSLPAYPTKSSWNYDDRYYISGGVIHLGSNTITPLTSFTETDPTVPSWAKASTKPSYTWDEITSKPTTFTPPTASSSVLGGVKIGTTMEISSGVINQKSGIVTAGTYKSLTVDTYGRVTAGTNPTTLAGYGITDAVKGSTTWWGRSIVACTGNNPDTVSGDLSSVGDISFSASGKNIGGLIYFNTTNSQVKVASNSTLVQLTRGNGTFTPKLYVDGYAGFNGEIYANGLDLVGSNASGNAHGGYIDFHYNASTADFTTRIIESTNGVISVTKSGSTASDITGLIIGNSRSGDYIQIGAIRIVYDNTDNKNALKIVGSDGSSAANFYATGAVSALGSNSQSGGGGVGDVTWELLASQATNGRYIHQSYIQDAVAYLGYAKQTWVTQQIAASATGGTVTAVKVGSTTYNPTSGVVSLPAYPTSLPASDVYAWAKASTKPSYTLDEVSDGSTRKLANYLPLTGGTLSNINDVLKIASSNSNVWIYFKSTISNTLANRASIGYYNNFACIANEVTYARIGVNDAGTPQYWSNSQSSTAKTLWHEGNDGSGSGLDADLLDGQHGSYYAAATSLSNYLPLSGGTLTGNLYVNNSWLHANDIRTYGYLSFSAFHDANNAYGTGTCSMYFNQKQDLIRIDSVSNISIKGDKVWHAGNDGSGSGLDADLVDGYHIANIVYAINGSGFGTSEATGISDSLTRTQFWRDNSKSGSGAIGVFVSHSTASTYGWEFYTGYANNGDFYGRIKAGGTWGDKYTFITSANYTSYTVTKTGTGASGSWNINSATATKLATARTIWGQSFDGTANVTGELSLVSNIDSLLYFDTTNSKVGIGVSSPSSALDVNGKVTINNENGYAIEAYGQLRFNASTDSISHPQRIILGCFTGTGATAHQPFIRFRGNDGTARDFVYMDVNNNYAVGTYDKSIDLYGRNVNIFSRANTTDDTVVLAMKAISYGRIFIGDSASNYSPINNTDYKLIVKGNQFVGGKLYLYRPTANSDSGAVWIEYDTNAGAVKLNGNFYATGAVSAIGAGTSGGGSTGDFSAIVNSLNQSSTAVGTGFLYSNGGAWSFQSTSSFWKTTDFTLKTASSYSIQSLGWTDNVGDNARVVTATKLAYWNGLYDGNSTSSDIHSNLAYCNQGAFGTIVTKSDDYYIPTTGYTSINGSLAPLSTNSDIGSSERHWGQGYINDITCNNISMDASTSQLSISGYGSTLYIKATEIYNPASSISIQGDSQNPRNLSLCAGGGNVGVGASANSSYKLYVNGSSCFNGNVGIGTTSSVVKLNVDGVAQATELRLSHGFCIDWDNSNTNAYTIGEEDSDIYAAGDWYGRWASSSDVRLKDIDKYLDGKLEDIALAPIFSFRWKNKPNKPLELGTSAQYWKVHLSYGVTQTHSGYLALDYGATALAAAVFTARKVLEHEGRIRLLEIENQALRKEIEQLKKAA